MSSVSSHHGTSQSGINSHFLKSAGHLGEIDNRDKTGLLIFMDSHLSSSYSPHVDQLAESLQGCVFKVRVMQTLRRVSLSLVLYVVRWRRID